MKTFPTTLIVIALIAFLKIDWHLSIQTFNGYELNQLVLDDTFLMVKLSILVFAAVYSAIHLVAWLAKKVKLSIKA